MELTAAQRPFLYVPLGHHFEQNFHVAHRLDRQSAGRRLEAFEVTSAGIAAAMAEELEHEAEYLPVRPGGAARAAQRIAELLD
jgi:UDP-N-acetylglucosamine:LPS N-acetylglucosamine transferase